MRRVILWIAAILITFAIGVGADRLWWYFLAAPPVTKVEPIAANVALPKIETSFMTRTSAPAVTRKTNLVLDFDPEKFSVWAAFYIMGPHSKEFEDIISLEVMLSPEVNGYPGTIGVSTRNGNDYDTANANFGLVTERRLFFVTNKLGKNDFEYRFDGQFLRTDFEAVARKNKAVLRGTLTKMKNGRTVAQEEFTFRMEFMGC